MSDAPTPPPPAPPAPPSDEAKKALQAEVVAVKQKWGTEIKLSKAKADSPTAPLPISVARSIAQPADASSYDVNELIVKLWIDSLDEGGGSHPVRVEVAGEVPEALQQLMAAHIDKRWRTELSARGAGKGWLLEKMLGWAESQFVDLLTLDPTFIDSYEGVNEEGMTVRRYTIAEPPPEEEESSDDSDDDSDDEEEEDIDARVGKMSLSADEERAMRIKLKAEEEADRIWREQRRAEHEALGEDAGGFKPPSKKEKAAQKEEKDKKSGSRLRKAGAKHNKFDAEAAGKKKNKKNGLMH